MMESANKNSKSYMTFANKGIIMFLAILFQLGLTKTAWCNDIAINPIRTILVDDKAWHFNWASFDQDKIITYNDYQYTCYWDEDSVLAIVRRNLKSNKIQTLRLQAYKLTIRPNDGHRNAVIGVSPADGRLHLSWDNHGNDLRYTRTRKNFLTIPPDTISKDDFESMQHLAPNAPQKATYPRFFNDADDNLYFVYRSGVSGNGKTIFARYRATKGTWKIFFTSLFGPEGIYRPWNNSSARNAYLHDILFDNNNRLHITWIYREKGCNWGCNHDLHYAYSDDFGVTWMNNDGQRIADLNHKDSIIISDPGIIIQKIPVNSWLMNQCAMTLDSKNQPHVALFKLPNTLQFKKLSSATRGHLRFFHYWRDSNGTWWNSGPLKLDKGLTIKRRPNIVIDKNDAVLIYWSSKQGFLYYKAHAKNKWQDWQRGRLTGAEFSTNDTSKHDRYLIKKGVLSITVNPLHQEGGHGYALLDFNLSAINTTKDISNSATMD